MQREPIAITEDGNLRLPAWARDQFRRRKGEWRLVPSVDSIIILQRAEEGNPNPQRATLCGELVGSSTLLDVISMVNNSRWTGILAVLDGVTSKSISFKRGDIKAASSNQARDRMGEIIYRYGGLTREQLDEANREVTHNRKIGRVLVEKNFIDPHRLWHFIRLQVEEIFYSTLQLKQGSFYFFPREESEFQSALTLSAQELLMEGVRRIDELSYMKERIPSPSVVFSQKQTPSEAAKLDEKEKNIFQLVDGIRDVTEIARLAETGEFEATKALFQLLQGGYVQIIEEDSITDVGGKTGHSERLTQFIQVFNAIFRRVYASKIQDGNESLFRGQLAAFLASSTSYPNLFISVYVGADGSLPFESLLINLEAMRSENLLDIFYQALYEYLSYQLMLANEPLFQEEQEALQSLLQEEMYNAS